MVSEPFYFTFMHFRFEHFANSFIKLTKVVNFQRTKNSSFVFKAVSFTFMQDAGQLPHHSFHPQDQLHQSLPFPHQNQDLESNFTPFPEM